MELFSSKGKDRSSGKKSRSKKPATQTSLKGNTLSNQFIMQLNELMTVLDQSCPRYIRCIKPNSKKSPEIFDSRDVNRQLKCAGMLEAIRIRKAGYSIRRDIIEFCKRYRILSVEKKIQGVDLRQMSAGVFKNMLKEPGHKWYFDPENKQWQLGVKFILMTPIGNQGVHERRS